jgi:hypothetical protein
MSGKTRSRYGAVHSMKVRVAVDAANRTWLQLSLRQGQAGQAGSVPHRVYLFTRMHSRKRRRGRAGKEGSSGGGHSGKAV